MQFNYKKIPTICISAILAGNLILLSYYIFINFKYLFNTDASIAIILADDMLKHLSFFPSQWNYSLELWVDRHIFFVPFVYFFCLTCFKEISILFFRLYSIK